MFRVREQLQLTTECTQVREDEFLICCNAMNYQVSSIFDDQCLKCGKRSESHAQKKTPKHIHAIKLLSFVDTSDALIWTEAKLVSTCCRFDVRHNVTLSSALDPNSRARTETIELTVFQRTRLFHEDQLILTEGFGNRVA